MRDGPVQHGDSSDEEEELVHDHSHSHSHGHGHSHSHSHGHSHSHSHAHVHDEKCEDTNKTFLHVYRKEFMMAIAILTTVYAIVEVSIALYINSLALFSDGIHNFSDVLTLGVAFWADWMESNNKDRAYTYGSSRFEILGGLINCVFLIATAAYVIVEAIPALIWAEEFRGSTMLIITSAIGFLINLFATVFFGGHHHGHSHGGHSHEEPAKKHGHEHHGHSEKSHGNVNSYAVFIHFLGDALSSLCVMFGGILAHIFPSASWIGYVDPVASLIIVAIMVGSAIPVLRTCCKIVLQKAPQHIDVLELEDSIASSDKRIKSVKDLRVWQMSHEKLVCSVRVKLVQGLSLNDVSQVVEGIRTFLKEENNIDDVTVEPIVKNA